MGQKISKNLTFPQSCISKNQVFKYSDQVLQPFYSDNLIKMVNSKIQILTPKKLISPVQNLTFLTYNVWFQNHNSQNRIASLLKLLQLSNADFICLQQVTHSFWVQLLSRSFIKNNYYVSGFKMSGYEAIILSKFQCNFYKYEYTMTQMNRSLIVAQLEINGKKIGVATSHFQSLNNWHRRRVQLKFVFEVLNKYDEAILMGDFNFDSSWKNQQAHIDPKFEDIWIKLKNDQKGYTMPLNLQYPPWRPDRILLKKSQLWKPLQIERIGNFTVAPFQQQDLTKIQDDGIVRTPSDHFGLVCQISLKTQQKT